MGSYRLMKYCISTEVEEGVLLFNVLTRELLLLTQEEYADSSVGKSTHTGLWRQVFGDERVKILNDDKPALRFEKGIWYAYGTPWSGKYGMNLNLRYPVAGICFLKQGAQNKIESYKHFINNHSV